MIVAPDAECIAQQTTGQRDNSLWGIVWRHHIIASNFAVVLAAIARKKWTKVVDRLRFCHCIFQIFNFV